MNALREVEDALTNVEQRQLQRVARTNAQEAAARAKLVASARYEHGIKTYLDVIDAERSMLTAERATVQNHTHRHLAAVALARALGAGWTLNPL